ncbi:hypothetical protein [Enterobacter kobei]|uniref:hypothetical protein n=1 Tax=Enterobacter kobei TaxID=208224 RepID=UPI000FCB0754|nr:hypothetical protein [Enterobacter kobei]
MALLLPFNYHHSYHGLYPARSALYICTGAGWGHVWHMSSSLFFAEDPKTPGSGSSFRTPSRSGAEAQYVAVLPAAHDAICCVTSLPRDPPRGSGFWHFAYSLTVVHFRKVVIRQKIGSAGNGHPVI